MKYLILFLSVFCIIFFNNCSPKKTSSKKFVSGVMTAQNYQYLIDISSLKPVPDSINGGHYGGFGEIVPVDGGDVSVEAKNIADEIGFSHIRYPGGGHLKFMHLMHDKNGVDSKGYGYDLAEITDYINNGGGTSKDLQDWTNTVNEQNKLNYRYIDRFVDHYNSLIKKPKVIFGMNVTLGNVDENFEALNFLISKGVQIEAIEMGNEAYSQFNSFEEYYVKVSPYLEKLKVEHPELVRTVVMAPFTGRKVHTDWNSGFNYHKGLSDLIQAGVYHFYPQTSQGCQDLFSDYITPKKNFQIQYDAKDAIIGPVMDCIYTDFKSMSSDQIDTLKTNLESTFPGVPVYMTEWNYTPTDGGFNTLAEAFFSFKAIKKLQDISQIKAATVHNFVAPAGHALVSPQSDYDSIEKPLHKRAKYYAFLMHSMAQGYQEAASNIPYSNVYSYYKDGSFLIIGINDSGYVEYLDPMQIGIDGYNTKSCSFSGVYGKQLYSSAGSNDFIGKNNYYKTNPAPYEINGLENLTEIPGYGLFNIKCDIEKAVENPPVVEKPWYCTLFPFLKKCKI